MISNKFEYVSAGNIILGKDEGIIVSTPLGSCIAVCAYDATKKTGGMAHVMLPGKSLDSMRDDKYKYAENAINSLIEQLIENGAQRSNLKISLLGGANVLRKEGDTFVKDLIDSVLSIVSTLQLMVVETSLGGIERRIVTLDLNSGNVFFTIGNSSRRILCKL